MARAKASVRCMGEELFWSVEQTPSEVEARVEAALSGGEEFTMFTIADPEGEPSTWNGRELRLRTKFVTVIAPALSLLEEE